MLVGTIPRLNSPKTQYGASSATLLVLAITGRGDKQVRAEAAHRKEMLLHGWRPHSKECEPKKYRANTPLAAYTSLSLLTGPA